jgi:hypothetical protein
MRSIPGFIAWKADLPSVTGSMTILGGLLVQAWEVAVIAIPTELRDDEVCLALHGGPDLPCVEGGLRRLATRTSRR